MNAPDKQIEQFVYRKIGYITLETQTSEGNDSGRSDKQEHHVHVHGIRNEHDLHVRKWVASIVSSISFVDSETSSDR